MKIIGVFLFLLSTIMQAQVIYSPQEQVKEADLITVNDGVMGGVSSSKIEIDDIGNLVFTGEVSLENNGGFASFRMVNQSINFGNKRTIELKVKGDGSDYKLNLSSAEYPYAPGWVNRFSTSGEWQIIRLNLDDFIRSMGGFRGIPELDLSNIRIVGILIGDKQKGDFKLEVEYIKIL